MTKKRPTVGLEDFAQLIRDGYYYVDKTYVVKEVLESGSNVSLFTRPRRFGKTLTLDMLKCFFEIGGPKDVFEGLKISQEKEICEQYQGKYPVIFISLKSVEGLTFEVARSELAKALSKETLRHPFLATSDKLNESEKGIFQQLCDMQQNAKAADIDLITGCFYTLSELLYKHYEQKVIILIDEYDVPLDKSEQNGFYKEMVSLIRGLFNQALKTNPYMKFAVMTGCLRIAKESIFTGLNKVKVYTVLDRNFSDAFGYTDEEVRAMLEYLDLSKHYEDIKAWYDGYQFGDKHIYCPWDVNNYCRKLFSDPNGEPEAFWINTSGNDIVRKFIEMSEGGLLKRELEKLIAGETVQKEVQQELTYQELYTSIDNIWSVLFTTGYLTQEGKANGDFLNLRIPNYGIREIFNKQVFKWIKDKFKDDVPAIREFCELFPQGKPEEIERRFNEFLRRTISVRDFRAESFYHGCLLGMMAYMPDTWTIESNREAGDGYCDISIGLIETGVGVIIEMKHAKDRDLEKHCMEALAQIEARHYEEKLLNDPSYFEIKTVLKYGIACYGKSCKVMLRV